MHVVYMHAPLLLAELNSSAKSNNHSRAIKMWKVQSCKGTENVDVPELYFIRNCSDATIVHFLSEFYREPFA